MAANKEQPFFILLRMGMRFSASSINYGGYQNGKSKMEEMET